MKWLKMYGLKDRRVSDEMDFDNDVSPVPEELKAKEPTVQEQLNEVLRRIDAIERKVDRLCKSK